MPLYEYRCKSCGHQFEKIQSFSAPEEKVCPVCGEEVERLISAPAIQFKGSGWYVNDYAAKPASGSSKSAESKGSDGASASKPDAGSSPASDAKPAASSGSSSATTASKSE
ncbi:FmdB family zinc ribbon protein [Paracidobacterium acidisoli]|uniref:Zinc ribbon domain-containing protein n=1 Tax=Paracidobacterium acidisoli TaxID=2303751 RepID=A0A372INY5_9BACT|nr:zinc ribbon domain-containing protein [Paracidobacterium acidisoli]